VSAAGCCELIDVTGIEKHIVQAGFTPRQRNQEYALL